MKERDVEEAILELLARDLKTDARELETDLLAKGVELPIDSPHMVEIILDLEEKFDIRLPDDTATADAMRSVCALARRICQVAVRPPRREKPR